MISENSILCVNHYFACVLVCVFSTKGFHAERALIFHGVAMLISEILHSIFDPGLKKESRRAFHKRGSMNG